MNAASRSPRLDRVTGEDVVGRVRVEDGRQLRRARRRPAPRLAERRPVGCGEERQRLGVMLDLAADRDEDRLVGLDRADDVLAGDVGRRHDHDLRPVERRVEVERLERGVGVRRADGRAVPRPGDDDVVGVQGGAGQLGRSLAPQRRGRARPARYGRGWRLRRRLRDDERVWD